MTYAQAIGILTLYASVAAVGFCQPKRPSLKD
jgi:hypothetical protein